MGGPRKFIAFAARPEPNRPPPGALGTTPPTRVRRAGFYRHSRGEASGRDDERLLDEVELLEAERWLAKPVAGELGHSEAVSALTKASRRAADARQRLKEEEERRVRERAGFARRMQVLSVVLALAFLASAALAVYAFKLQRQARQKEEEARASEDKARKSEREAQENFRRFKESQMEAQEAHARAEHSSQEAAETSRRLEEQQQLRQSEEEAENLFIRSDYDKALAAYNRLRDQYKELENIGGQANAWTKLGQIYVGKENYPYAVRCYQKALEFRDKEKGPNSEEAGAIYKLIADVYLKTANDRASLIQARKSVDRALGIYRSKRLAANHRAVAEANQTRQWIMERRAESEN
ncbi:MAG TPA: tetratricopeptide repeat protein [Pyrinomonadaceae bacterium]|nr:tetratricopeptide repeat protein [Pyrinomonadaceae bacterium]